MWIVICFFCIILCSSATVSTTVDCSSNDIDLVFVVDSSGSICKGDGQTPQNCRNWEFILAFMNSIVDELTIGEYNTRVGVVQFGNQGFSKFYLNSHYNKEDVMNEISTLPFLDQYTNTSGGIRVAMIEQYISSRGERNDKENVMILITDGESTFDNDRTISDAEAARKAGVKILSIGVTRRISVTEVKGISSEPQQENVTYWLVNDFDNLQDIVQALVQQTCTVVSSAEETYTLMSAVRDNGVPFIAVIEGNPEVWTKILQKGGSLHLRSISANQNTTLFKKLGVHYGKSKVIYSDGKRADTAVFNLEDVLGGTGSINTVHFYTSTEIGGITVDWVSDNIYWTDQVYNWIVMSPLEGKANVFHTVIDTELDVPGGIAVHPGTSQLFWTDYGSQPKIERSTLYGTERTTIVSAGLTTPRYLNIDYSTHTLYWVDTGRNLIGSSDLDGDNFQTFLQSSFISSLTGFTLYGDFMFGVSDNKRELYTIELSDPQAFHTSNANFAHIYDIQIFAASEQPSYSRPCDSAPCTSMCVGKTNNTGYQCVCPDTSNLLFDYDCQGSVYIEDPRYIYTLLNALCWYPVWTPVMKDEEISHKCLSNFTVSSSYFVGHIYAQRYLYVASEFSINSVIMKLGYRYETRIENVGSIKGFAVDWISQNIYWTNSEGIMVATADCQYLHKLLSLSDLNGLTVDPTQGYLYFTRVSTQTYIGRMFLNGDSATTFVSSVLGRPEQLTVDFADERLYWTDSLYDRIESIKTDGTGRKVIITMSNSHPFGVATFQDHLMWTDQTSGEPGLHWAYKDGTGQTIRSVQKAATTGNVVLYGEYSQPAGYTNGCSSNKGGCSHICLPKPGGRTCKCGTGYILHSDGKTCKTGPVLLDTAVIFVDRKQGEIFQMDLSDYSLSAIKVSNLRDPTAIDIDPLEELIFWTDVEAKTIKRSTLSGDGEVILKQLSLDSIPGGLAVDWEAKLVFYTDTGQDMIMRMDYDGNSVSTLITSLDDTGAIVLDFDSQKMYWTDRGIVPKIETANYFSSNRRTIVSVTNIAWPNGLTMDREEQVLYWCDGQLGRVESINTDGTNRRLLFSETGERFYGAAFLNDYIYLTSWNSGHIQRLHKNGGTISNIGDRVVLKAYGITAYQKISPASTTTTTPTITTAGTTTPTQSTTTTLPSTTATPTSSSTATPSRSTVFSSTASTNDPETASKGEIASSVIIIIALVLVALIIITISLIVGIYCCIKKKRNNRDELQHLNRTRPGQPPPPYTFTNDTFKAEGNVRPASSIYATIEDNPSESATQIPDKVEASPGHNCLQDVTPPEKSTGMQAAGIDSIYITLSNEG